MSDPERGSRPESDPTDERVEHLREKAMDLLADATVHVQRLEEIGERLGITPDLVEGVGDQLYRAAIAQMDFAAKVMERSFVAAERLWQSRGAHRRGERFHRVDIGPGATRASFHFTVRNASLRSADVEAHVAFVPKDAVSLVVGTRHLHSKQETSVEVTLDGSKLLAPGGTFVAAQHAGDVSAWLVHAGGQRIELPRTYFEVWVHAS
jgi:hypothetical protein